MVAQYPGLSDVLDRVNRSYEDLFASEPLEFHLAYVACLEATFPPLFTFMIDNRAHLFAGDERVASLFLWHYVEEIEHRSSAGIIYDGVVGNRWYRMRVLPKTMRHVLDLSAMIAQGFATCVPADDIGIDPTAATSAMLRDEVCGRIPLLRRFSRPGVPPTFSGIPTRDVMKLLAGLVKSQLPGHQQSDVATPQWFYTWMDSYAAGEDMAHYYGLPPARPATPTGTR